MQRTMTVLAALVALALCSCQSLYAESFRIVGATDGYIGMWAPGPVERISYTYFATPTLTTSFSTWHKQESVYIRFNLSDIPSKDYATCSSAKLVLTVSGVNNPEGKTLEISRIAEENTNTDPSKFDYWNNDKTVPRPWTSNDPENLGYQITCGTGTLDSLVPTGVGKIELDVTDALQKWLYEDKPNNGFVIQLGGPIDGIPGDPSFQVDFYASESSQYLRPRLEMELTGTGPGEPPVEDEYSLTPVADGYMGANQGGGINKDFTGATMTSDFWAWWSYSSMYVRFDLSSIHRSGFSGVDNAKLYLNVSSLNQPETPVALNVRAIAGANSNTDVGLFDFWNNDTSVPRAWTGGGYGFQQSCGDGATITVTPTATGQLAIDVTSLVDAWLYGGRSNVGLVLQFGGVKGGWPDGNNHSITVDTSEAASEAARPRLEVKLAPSTLPPGQYSVGANADGYVTRGGNNFTSTTMAAYASPWWDGGQCLLKFGLSDLKGVTGYGSVSSATLTLNVAQVGGLGDCTVWQLGPTPWNTSATMGTYDGVNIWPNYAGLPSWGYDGQSGSAVIPATAVTRNITGVGSYTWDVKSIVDKWLYGGASNSNSGLLIGTWQFGYGNFTGNSPAVSFYATEDTNAALRPILEIDVVPEPSSLAALAVGGLGLVGFSLRRRR